MTAHDIKKQQNGIDQRAYIFSHKDEVNIKPLSVVSYEKLSNLELILNLFPLQLRYALPEK